MECENLHLTEQTKVGWKNIEGESGTGTIACHWHIGDTCMIDVITGFPTRVVNLGLADGGDEVFPLHLQVAA